MSALSKAITSFIGVISEHWGFDSEHYPGTGSLSDPDRRDENVLHMVLHVTTRAGNLARILERHRHRKRRNLSPNDLRRARKLAVKIITDGFRLFIQLGGSEEEIIRYITKAREPLVQ